MTPKKTSAEEKESFSFERTNGIEILLDFSWFINFLCLHKKRKHKTKS
jgi:hypothetical protein